MKMPMFKAKNPTAHAAINTTAIRFSISFTLYRLLLKYTFSLDYPEYYRNKRNNKKDVNDTAGAVSKKSNGPGDDQDYCDDVKEISHV
jgi:hypothetical protein